MPSSGDRPDIEIRASVRAKRLRTGRRPDADVRHEGESSSVTERRNLPDEIEPGVTYRDVEVRRQVQVRAVMRHMQDEVTRHEGGRDR